MDASQLNCLVTAIDSVASALNHIGILIFIGLVANAFRK